MSATVTVGIKALNEEKHIAAAIASAVAAVRPYGGQVIVADSGSSDGTLAIARQFPVRIFQLARPDERSCGAGAQLAFQYATGEYFYLLDGDMVLHPDFLSAAISFLESHPDIAGVGGNVHERNVGGAELAIRTAALQIDRNRLAGTVDRLDGGGLYRATAVHGIGYFADRNLHAFEEFDLASRLQSKGWKLARIDCPAVDHYGHNANGYTMLWRRIRSGYMSGLGEMLRGAICKPHLPIILSRLRHVRYCGAVYLWWALLLGSLTGSLPLFTTLLLAPLAALALRRRSVTLGLYSMVGWNVAAAGLIAGLLHRHVPPEHPIEATEIASGGDRDKGIVVAKRFERLETSNARRQKLSRNPFRAMSPGRVLLRKVDRVVVVHGAALIKLRAERLAFFDDQACHDRWDDEVRRFINSQIAETLDESELAQIERHHVSIQHHVARRVAEIAATQWTYH
jgi:glycosyltransferase involved in cell wall biosynthesis